MKCRWARTFSKLLELAGGVRQGRKLKAVIPAALRRRSCLRTS
jgi:NADH:ubiquinone oxidoreductase subunit F (NADH-binding)